MNNTYSNQVNLPNLPVPDLKLTIAELLNWTQPIVSKSDFLDLQKEAEAFLENEGPVLQKKLKTWDDSLEGSWLKPFWDESYLDFRAPVVANMNYFALMESKQFNLLGLTELVGHFIYQTTRAFIELSDESMSPEFAKDTPLCMDQYRNTMCTTRIPSRDIDEMRIGELDKKNKHVVLLYRGRFFRLSVTNSKGELYAPEAFAGMIDDLISDDMNQGDGIGVFTTAMRDDAAEFYNSLKLNSINKANLRVIEDALVVVCIDDEAESENEVLRNLLMSTSSNRYFDKACQLIINKNGSIGFNNEHTGADGTTWFTIFEKIHNNVGLDKREDTHALSLDLSVMELEWALSDAQIQRLLFMKKTHELLEDQYFVDALVFDDFGKNEIKKLKVSPDAFFHVALQAAQYKLNGHLNSTYEPVAMRYFKEGRTECNRPCTSEALDFAREISSESADESVLRDLAKKACKAHGARIKKCQSGEGVERHLLGLQSIQRKYGQEVGVHDMPSLFNTTAYKSLKHDHISTSGLGYEYVKAFGFGPVVTDGFGIGYGVRTNSITICTSSRSERRSDLEKLNHYFFDMLRSLRTVLAEEH